MKLLRYAGVSYSTGTAIADAVLAYSVALARRGLTELVQLPILSEAGERVHLDIPIGWMREIAGISQPGIGPELLDADTVEHLTAKTEQLDRPIVRPDLESGTNHAGLWSDFDATEFEY